MRALVLFYAAALGVAAVLAFVERRSLVLGSAERRLDLAYWVVSPLVTGSLTRAVTLGAYGVIGFAAIGGRPEEGFALFDSPLRALPFLLQLALALVLADFVGYWSHRLRHRWLWPLHRIHHGSTRLVSLSAARMHPLDELADGLVIGLVLLAAGFDWEVFGLVAPITMLYTLVTHADVSWTFGPLGEVLVSPRFHRWHHERAHVESNYSGMFPIWDRLFGTYQLPGGEPASFGVEGGVPQTLAAQLFSPAGHEG